jgi:5'-deoxynucleotidase YfbR-like HD superfamily hydrolase
MNRKPNEKIVVKLMDSRALLKLFHDLGKLKTLTRQGWLRVGITNPESVADHSFRTAFIAMMIGEQLSLDIVKVLKMSLLHDLAEIVIGDITPYDKLTVDEKRSREDKAVLGLLSGIPNYEEYLSIWREYSEQKNNEAALVRNIDKLEMALQASEYQREFPELDLTEFLEDAENYINIPMVKELFAGIRIEFIELNSE